MRPVLALLGTAGCVCQFTSFVHAHRNDNRVILYCVVGRTSDDCEHSTYAGTYLPLLFVNRKHAPPPCLWRYIALLSATRTAAAVRGPTYCCCCCTGYEPVLLVWDQHQQTFNETRHDRKFNLHCCGPSQSFSPKNLDRSGVCSRPRLGPRMDAKAEQSLLTGAAVRQRGEGRRRNAAIAQGRGRQRANVYCACTWDCRGPRLSTLLHNSMQIQRGRTQEARAACANTKHALLLCCCCCCFRLFFLSVELRSLTCRSTLV